MGLQLLQAGGSCGEDWWRHIRRPLQSSHSCTSIHARQGDINLALYNIVTSLPARYMGSESLQSLEKNSRTDCAILPPPTNVLLAMHAKKMILSLSIDRGYCNPPCSAVLWGQLHVGCGEPLLEAHCPLRRRLLQQVAGHLWGTATGRGKVSREQSWVLSRLHRYLMESFYPSSRKKIIHIHNLSWLVLGGEPSYISQDCRFSRTSKVGYN